MDHAIQKRVSRHMRTAKPRSACAFAQSDQGLHCPLTESLDTTECKKRTANRKEGNDQESIQFPNTFRPRRQKEGRTYLKQRHHNENTTSKKPKGQVLSQKLAKRLSKIKIYQDIRAKTYNGRNSKQQQKQRLYDTLRTHKVTEYAHVRKTFFFCFA